MAENLKFLGFTNNYKSELAKVKESIFYGKHSRFDAPNSDENLFPRNKIELVSVSNIVELIHIELDNWYETTKLDFQKLSEGGNPTPIFIKKIAKDLKKTYAKMTTTFSNSLAREEEQYKQELNMMLSLARKCDNHIEHLKELAGNMQLNPVERKGKNIL